MGLVVDVGSLAERLANDPDDADDLRSLYERVDNLLISNGVEGYSEPEELPELLSRCWTVNCAYSDVLGLRRVYAHTVNDPDWVASPAPNESDTNDVAVIREQTLAMSSHFLTHSLYEGFFVPVDFEHLILGDEEIGILGSSHALRRELALIAPKLGITLTAERLADSQAEAIENRCEAREGLWAESIAWLLHWEAARLSIEHRTAIVYG